MNTYLSRNLATMILADAFISRIDDANHSEDVTIYYAFHDGTLYVSDDHENFQSVDVSVHTFGTEVFSEVFGTSVVAIDDEVRALLHQKYGEIFDLAEAEIKHAETCVGISFNEDAAITEGNGLRAELSGSGVMIRVYFNGWPLGAHVHGDGSATVVAMAGVNRYYVLRRADAVASYTIVGKGTMEEVFELCSRTPCDMDAFYDAFPESNPLNEVVGVDELGTEFPVTESDDVVFVGGTNFTEDGDFVNLPTGGNPSFITKPSFIDAMIAMAEEFKAEETGIESLSVTMTLKTGTTLTMTV